MCVCVYKNIFISYLTITTSRLNLAAKHIASTMQKADDETDGCNKIDYIILRN